MRRESFQTGQSLMEILFAITIFTVGVVTIGYLIFDAELSVRLGIESTQARLLASESIEAVRTIADDSFLRLPAGTYGVVLVDDMWELDASTSYDDTFTRTITISDVDEETKKIESSVDWDMTAAREGHIALVTYLSDWTKTTGEAAMLSIDADLSTRSASGTVLGDITLFNIGDGDITISEMQLEWHGEGTVDDITIGGTSVFTATTSEGAPSATLIDITDFVILENAPVLTLGPIVFSSDMTDKDLIITFVLLDGTRRHVFVGE